MHLLSFKDSTHKIYDYNDIHIFAVVAFGGI